MATDPARSPALPHPIRRGPDRRRCPQSLNSPQPMVVHPAGEQRYFALASASPQLPPIRRRLAIIQLPDLGLSILSMMSTTAAGSGHPTSCMSAVELVAGTFFYAMKFDPKNANSPDGDRFVLSKGHAAPVLYAALAEAGVFPESRLVTLRGFSSDLEGHPTPRIPGVDAATGRDY